MGRGKEGVGAGERRGRGRGRGGGGAGGGGGVREGRGSKGEPRSTYEKGETGMNRLNMAEGKVAVGQRGNWITGLGMSSSSVSRTLFCQGDMSSHERVLASILPGE